MVRLLCILWFVAACADGSKNIERLADRACACKDAACAQTVLDDLVAFAKANPNMQADKDNAFKQIQRLDTCAGSAGITPDKLDQTMKQLQAIH